MNVYFVFKICRYLILPVPRMNYSKDKPTDQAMLYPTYSTVTVLDQSNVWLQISDFSLSIFTS